MIVINYRNVHKSTVSQSLNSDQKWWKQKIVIQYCPLIYTCRKGKKPRFILISIKTDFDLLRDTPIFNVRHIFMYDCNLDRH